MKITKEEAVAYKNLEEMIKISIRHNLTCFQIETRDGRQVIMGVDHASNLLNKYNEKKRSLQSN